LTLALASEAADAAKEDSDAAQQRAFAMSPFACVMAAWCALRSDSVPMLQAALSVFAEVRNKSAFSFVFVCVVPTNAIACSLQPRPHAAAPAALFPHPSLRGACTATTEQQCSCGCCAQGNTPAFCSQKTKYLQLPH
jgi:hypothetical protein